MAAVETLRDSAVRGEVAIGVTEAVAVAAGVIIAAIPATWLGIAIVVTEAVAAGVVMAALLAEGLDTWRGIVLLGIAAEVAVAVVVRVVSSAVNTGIWQGTVSVGAPLAVGAVALVTPVGKSGTWLGIAAGEEVAAAVVVAVAVDTATVLDPVAVAVSTVDRLGILLRSVQPHSKKVRVIVNTRTLIFPSYLVLVLFFFCAWWDIHMVFWQKGFDFLTDEPLFGKQIFPFTDCVVIRL